MRLFLSLFSYNASVGLGTSSFVIEKCQNLRCRLSCKLSNLGSQGLCPHTTPMYICRLKTVKQNLKLLWGIMKAPINSIIPWIRRVSKGYARFIRRPFCFTTWPRLHCHCISLGFEYVIRTIYWNILTFYVEIMRAIAVITIRSKLPFITSPSYTFNHT